MHGARVVALRGNFDQALELVRELCERHPIALVNSVNPFRLEGQKTAAFEVARGPGRRRRRGLPAGRQRRQHHRLLEGLRRERCAPRDVRLPGRGRRAAGHGPARREARDRRQRDPDRQPGALGGGDERDARLARRASRPSATTQILDAYRLLAAREGVFCEPASAASVAGLLAPWRRRRAADRLRAHRPRAEGPADRAGAGRLGRAVRGDDRRGRARGAGMNRRRVVRVPASLGEPRPGLRRVRRRARAAHGARGGGDRRASPSRPTCRSRRDRRNLAVRGFERLHPPDDFTFRIRSDIPLQRRPGHERGRLRRRADGRRPPVRARRRRARRMRRELEGHPDNVAAALLGGFVDLRRRRRRRASTRRPGWRRCSSCRTSRCARARRARRCPTRCRWPTRSTTSATPRCWRSAWPAATGTSSPAGSATACTSPTARTCTRARRSSSSARATLGALGATISGAGPTVLVWCHYEQTGGRRGGAAARGRGLGRRAAARRSSPGRGRRASC